MRARLTLIGLLLTLAGCAFTPRTAGPSRAPVEPLHARIQPPETGSFGFYLNRPAYVALFEIVPGVGTSLIYPGPGYGSHVQRRFAGHHFLGHVGAAARSLYLPVTRTGFFSQPRFFFLIASERPLRLDQFGTYGLSLRSTMGFASFASLNAFNSMERLVELAVPDPGASYWVSDYYVYWPNVIHSVRSSRQLVAVSCGGTVLYVNPAFLRSVNRTLCGTLNDAPPVGDGDDAPPSEGENGARDRRPEGREPVPAEEGDRARTIRERIRQGSTQLQPAAEDERGRTRAPRWRRTVEARDGVVVPRGRPGVERAVVRGGSDRGTARRPSGSVTPARPEAPPRVSRPAPRPSAPAAPARPSSRGRDSDGSRPVRPGGGGGR